MMLALGVMLGAATWVLDPPVAAQPAEPAKPVVADTAGCLRTGASDPENAGRVPTGAMISRRLTFVNDSDQEARVSVISRTCGCLNASFSSETVPPGGQTELKLAVQVVPASIEQVQSVRFEVLCGTGEAQRRTVATARMRYRPTISVETIPEQIVAVGTVGEPTTLDVYLRALSPEDRKALRIESARSDHPSIRFDGMYEVKDAPAMRLARFVCDSVSLDGIRSVLILRSAAAKDSEMRIPVLIRPILPFRCTPGGVILSRAAPTRDVIVSRRQPVMNRLEPLSYRVDGSPGLRIALSASKDGATTVSLELEPSSPSCGHASVKLLLANGSVAGEIPVAWLD